MVSLRAVLPLALTLAACTVDPPSQTEPGTQAVAQPAAQPEAPKPEIAPADPKQLTAEEIALIEADPATLTPEQRRARGYALRKKIMQNPESESAKAIEEARQAAMAGELEVPGKPADNGVVIPAPDYLKNQDQSYGKPDL